ncbi:MAG: nucleoside transporter C-terminal domain-containing protein [Gemmatimonadales bacterium]|nr:nucleoside transporter C-terminal domain-containing protein [Gemmatimonadales bacterium]
MTGWFLLQTAAERLAEARGATLDTPFLERLMGLVGIATMLAIAYAISYDRKRINWRMVGAGVLLQIALGALVLKTPVGRALFSFANNVVTGLLSFQEQGARFVFGNLVQNTVPLGGGAEGFALTGAFFAFNVLPTIIFFSALMTVLYYLNIMQWIVKGIAWVMQKTLRTSGAETLSAAGNIFLGQTEAPLLIKPFVSKMTNSELNTVMVGGFATVAGGVMAAYVGMLKGYFPDIAGHLLTASVMNAPAGLLLSKMLLPETGVPETRDTLHIVVEKREANVIEAAASGAATGVQLAINVAAMLMAFVALVALLNFGVSWVAGLFGHPEVTLQWLLGKALWPITVLMGVPPADADTVGSFIGVKAILNEFVAYADFGRQMSEGLVISPKAAVMTTYCLLGFANLSSIAIQIGGIGGLAPERRPDVARLGLRAMIAGNLAAFMSASIAGMLV